MRNIHSALHTQRRKTLAQPGLGTGLTQIAQAMNQARTNFIRVFTHEARLMWADRSLWAVCGLLALLLGFGLHNGLAETKAREAVLAGIQAQQPQREAALAQRLERVLAGTETPEPFANPADPASVGGGMGARTALLPYEALAPLALGQSDMQPNYYRVTYRSRDSSARSSSDRAIDGRLAENSSTGFGCRTIKPLRCRPSNRPIARRRPTASRATVRETSKR